MTESTEIDQVSASALASTGACAAALSCAIRSTNPLRNRLAAASSSSPVVVAAQAALADEAYARSCIARTIAERGRVAALIAGLGYPTLPSRANFVSFDYGIDSAPLIARLAQQGVFMREWRDPGFETYVRMTIGLPEENDLALRSLSDTIAAMR